VTDPLVGLVSAFAGIVVSKAIIEPLAKNIGRAALNRYVEPICEKLDVIVEVMGLDFNPEAFVRHYLELAPEELSEQQVDQITEAVFKTWDLRLAAAKIPPRSEG
jgi:hypothetical protein|tara:strand:+ start:1260 stop:1574 length:315 start_codon:yes stop_codon:yes gene_type:complete